MRTPLRAAAALLLAAACATPRPPPPTAPRAEPAAPPAEAPAADRSQPPPLSATPPLALPEQRHFTLANGLRVRLVEQHRLPIVAFELLLDAGASRDPAELPGLASLTAAMVTEGTRLHTATELSDQVGYLGATLGAAAGPDEASLTGGCLSQHLGRFLELFSDAAMNPTFPREDFERVRDERRVLLLQQRDQPAIVAARAFLVAFWGQHPYGHPLLGTEASLARMRPADLARFHETYWNPANAELVVVGDVREAELRRHLDRTLGTWSGGRRAPALQGREPAAPHRTVLVLKPGAPQAFLTLGAPGLARSAPDYAAAEVMFEVLGGGTSSRLFRDLREEKGYTYGIGAGADARRLAGASVVRGSVKAEVTGAALQDLLGELRRMREEPVPADELAEAKDGLVRSLPAEFATVGGIAGQLGELVVNGLPDDYWNGYAQELERVTPADVQRAAQRYLDPARLTLVMVGPPEVQKQLGALPLGPLEVRRSAEGIVPPPARSSPRAPGLASPPPRPPSSPPNRGLLPRKPSAPPGAGARPGTLAPVTGASGAAREPPPGPVEPAPPAPTPAP